MAASNQRDPVADITSELDEETALAAVGVPHGPHDNIHSRLGIAIGLSIILNAAIWSLVAQVVHQKSAIQLPPATFRRIILPPPPKPQKQKPRPKPPHLKPKALPQPLLLTHPRPQSTQPPLSHNHVVTSTGPTTSAATAMIGGNAPADQPIQSQQPQNVPAPPSPPTPPAPTPQSPSPPQTKPVEPAPTPKPAPVPVGPTQDAESSNEVRPQIPDDITEEDFTSFVRAKVDIKADGSFIVTLLTSSGNDEIDQLVLQALKQWKWKPALVNGNPVESNQRFRFDFVVR